MNLNRKIVQYLINKGKGNVLNELDKTEKTKLSERLSVS